LKPLLRFKVIGKIGEEKKKKRRIGGGWLVERGESVQQEGDGIAGLIQKKKKTLGRNRTQLARGRSDSSKEQATKEEEEEDRADRRTEKNRGP